MTDLLVFYAPELLAALVVIFAALLVIQIVRTIMFAIRERKYMMGHKYDGQW